MEKNEYAEVMGHRIRYFSDKYDPEGKLYPRGTSARRPFIGGRDKRTRYFLFSALTYLASLFFSR